MGARLALATLLAVLSACGRSPNPMQPSGDLYGIAWTPDGPQPALSARACPSVDCFGMGDPALLRMADGQLVMWFTTGGTDGGPFLMRGTLDPVLVPTLDPDSPLMPIAATGTWDRFIETPSVVRDTVSGKLNLFYLGYRDTGFVDPAIGMMATLDSTGRTWTRPAAPIYRPTPGAWDGVFITGPCAVRGSDGVWRVYYTGAGTTVGIGLLTSTDGTTWTPHPGNPVFARRLGAWDEAVIEPCVRFLRGRWWMWYSGYREPLSTDTPIGIGLGVSDDGVHWTRVGNGPVLARGAPGSWSDLRVLAPDVIEQPDGSLLMAAYGQAVTDPGRTAGSIAFWRSR